MSRSKKSSKKRSPFRVRIAPSPTGFLHLGTVRTALFNWLFAKHHAGSFIIRMEDTDRGRSNPQFEKDILDGLAWLGMKPDEFYRQSERTKIYQRRLAKLLAEGKAFWCYHSKDELEAEKKEQFKRQEAPRHVCEHKKLAAENQKSGAGIVRLKVDEHSTRIIHFEDLIRGHIEFEQRTIGDISLAKDEQTPLYNFAVVVDDGEMKISHVIRGEDHITNTPKQILIAEALGVDRPQYAHLPLILGEDRSKLSKRHGVVKLDQYQKAGYLPEAVVNFLALLGWTPPEEGREVLSKSDMVDQFSLERVHKSPAVFNPKKLNWLNAQYLRMFNDRGWAKALEPFVRKHFGQFSEEKLVNLAPLFRERLEYLDQVREFHYFFNSPDYLPALLFWRGSGADQARKALGLIKNFLSSRVVWEKFDPPFIRFELDKIAQEHFARDRGAVYWPLRVALTGEKFSPDPVQIIGLLAEEEVLTRIEKAIDKLKDESS